MKILNYAESLFYILDREITRQNRIALFILVVGSIILLLSIIIGAPFYYYKYSRNDTKASISKNPNYGLIYFELNLFLFFEKSCIFPVNNVL